MQRIKWMIQLFLREPLWFKILILATLSISIIFSSSAFSEYDYFQSGSKIAGAIFFIAFGFNMRRNRKVSGVFFALAVVCIFLAIQSVY
jgi:amino acid permease